MRRRKYKVTVTPKSGSYYPSGTRVLVSVKRRGWFRTKYEHDVVGTYHHDVIEAADGSKHPTSWNDPVSETQIKRVAWDLVSEAEFPKPELVWCKTECKKL